MKINSHLTLATGLLLMWATAIPAQADPVIFSNLGPDDSYNGGYAWLVGTYDGGVDYLIAGSAFTVGDASIQLSTIELAVGLIRGDNQLTIDLDADSSGKPGSVIESFTINGAMPTLGEYSMGHLVTATSVLHPLLTAGSQYWVVVSVPNDGTTAAGWYYNGVGDEGPFGEGDNGPISYTSSQSRGAMLITGVPEPSGIVLASTAAVVILGCGFRRRGKAKSA